MRILDHATSIIIAAASLAHGTPAPTLTEIGAATVTGYSCEQGKETTGCAMTRWGGNPLATGAACPPEWKDRLIVVEGYEHLGTLRCDDTGLYDTWNGLPHIDVRTETRAEAVAIGVQTRNVWSVER